MSNCRFAGLFIALCLYPLAAHAQYWGEQVLEKSFEHTDFFFSPTYLNPYSLGGFGSAAAGLLTDPLLDLQVSPAYLASDSLSGQYAYLDFRNSREIVERRAVPYYMDYIGGARHSYIGYPRYYARRRTELAPVFSGAYFARPVNRLTLGATYQLVYQDERYYSVPQDIHKHNPTEAFAGDRSGSDDSIPIIDRYSGSDGMQQRGHFGAVYGAFRLLDHIDAGVRVGRTVFNRDGEFGSTNLWPSTHHRESFRSHIESRDQSYSHWDVTAGLNYTLTPGVVVGATGGYLWGDATQALAQQDTSHSAYSSPFDNYQSTYIHAGFKDQDWLHDGSAYHAGVQILAQVTPRTNIHAYYRRIAERADIWLSSALADTSYAASYRDYNNNVYNYLSHRSVSDFRTGSGDIDQVTHRAAVYFHWTINRVTNVRLGGNFASKRRSIDTEEDVTAHLHSYYKNTGTTHRSYERRRATDAEKTLKWDFDSRSFSLQIPVFMNRRLSDAVELLFGVNQHIAGWNITDVTLAIFDYRRQVDNGRTEYGENFGERYTQPRERLTDNQTTILAGLTITPAERFHIRLLMAPHFGQGWSGTTLREFQWWISLTATPGFSLGAH